MSPLDRARAAGQSGVFHVEYHLPQLAAWLKMRIHNTAKPFIDHVHA
jgi:hypothetical protein